MPDQASESAANEQAISHRPAVHEQVEVVPIPEAEVRWGDEAPQKPGSLAIHEGHQTPHLLTQQGRKALARIRHGWQHQWCASIRSDGPMDAGGAECQPRHSAPELGVFSIRGFEEPAAGGQLGEEVPNNHRGTAAAGDGRDFLDDPEFAAQAVARTFCLGAGEIEAAHAGDARQGLSAEAERAQVPQVLRRAHLARGVALQGQVQLVPGHAGSIVGHFQQPLAPLSQFTSMRGAPASRAFSANSFSTDAGRSTTSPAAI